MKKILFTVAAVAVALSSVQMRALAADWFDDYDHDHDHHWNYNEFRSAHRAWMKNHREEKAISEAELRHQFDTWDGEHHGWVNREHVEKYHAW